MRRHHEPHKTHIHESCVFCNTIKAWLPHKLNPTLLCEMFMLFTFSVLF